MSNYLDWEKSFESVQTTKKVNSLGILDGDFIEFMSKWRQKKMFMMMNKIYGMKENISQM